MPAPSDADGDVNPAFPGFKNIPRRISDIICFFSREKGFYVIDFSNLAAVCFIPQDASNSFDLRNSFGTTREDIEYVFRALSLEYGYTWQILSYYDPIYVAKDWPFIKVLGEAYKDITGELNCAPALSYGTTYAKAMPNIVAWGPVFPGEEDFCHRVDERISVKSLVKATKIYARALADMVFSPQSFK
jgi:acetylornithine deacetylase/succinyl-diaminopimelate desuccinylase-like protein